MKNRRCLAGNRSRALFSFCSTLVLLAAATSAFSPPSPFQRSGSHRDVLFPLQESFLDNPAPSDSILNTTLVPATFLEEAAVDCEVADGVPPATLNLENIPQEPGSSSSTTKNSLLSLALAGALASAIGDGTMHPMDTIKTLQQSDAGYGLSLPQAAQVVFEQSGWTGFYAGFLTYAASDAMGGSLKFVTFEVGKQWSLQKIVLLDNTTNNNQQQQRLQQSASLFACAALAFVASSIVVVPGELLKQQLQMNYYSGLPQAIVGILTHDGLRGFYTGYSGVFLRDIPYTMLELGLYDLFKNGMVNYKQQQQNDVMGMEVSAQAGQKEPSIALSTLEEILAAALTGGIAGYFTTPFDTIKTKVMVDQQQLYDGSFLDCFLSTVDQHGVAALFAGGAARVAWLVPFTAIYLPVYDILKRRFSRSVTTTTVDTTKTETETTELV